VAVPHHDAGGLAWRKANATTIVMILVGGMGAALAAGGTHLHLWLYVAAIALSAAVLWPMRSLWQRRKP
jgi:hypothetical protein